MAKLVLSTDEQERIEEILDTLTADNYTYARKLKPLLNAEEWGMVEAVIRGVALIAIESRLCIESFANRARDLGFEPDSKYETTTDVRPENLYGNAYMLTNEIVDRFDLPGQSDEDKARTLAWLEEHNPNWSTHQEHTAAEQALGIGIDGFGSNVLFDQLCDVETEAERLFFGDTDAELRELLDA